MTKEQREMIEQILFDLRYDMDCIGEAAEMWEELRRKSDDDLIAVFNDFVEGME